ncbi:hypothetical protein [Rhodoplanes serenus]|uniref:hypothetical protein n=1 Tax=Rhodoplanes serenus TaxID=200615 RepID=UPI000DAD969B|nr:hypothetical protein [Rhodoplanes serenus]RAI37106.1 hypothetical protein CH340_00950 [Rhodoplanes serenus]
MTQHEHSDLVRVVPAYELDTLGAPFKVVLRDSVSVGLDPQTGRERVSIPDFVGLVGAVVRSRVVHPRKLSGAEIKFLRSALGVKAKPVAGFLDMSAEHLSRCEAGTKIMSSTSERLFRLGAFLATFFEEPEDLFTSHSFEELEIKPSADQEQVAQRFLKHFLSLKIQTVFAADDVLRFEFFRRCAPDCKPCSDDGVWSDKKAA